MGVTRFNDEELPGGYVEGLVRRFDPQAPVDDVEGLLLGVVLVHSQRDVLFRGHPIQPHSERPEVTGLAHVTHLRGSVRVGIEVVGVDYVVAHTSMRVVRWSITVWVVTYVMLGLFVSSTTGSPFDHVG